LNHCLAFPWLMLVTEPQDDLPGTVERAVSGGVNAVQWRDNVTPIQALRSQASAMRTAVPRPNALIVNSNLAFEDFPCADGLHIPERRTSEPKLQAGQRILIGRSVHSVEGAKKAADEGADYIVVGTIFASKSHPEVIPQGLQLITRSAWVVDIPIIAIGGITPENLKDCIKSGASGVAVLSPIMRAAAPYQTAKAYRKALDIAWSER